MFFSRREHYYRIPLTRREHRIFLAAMILFRNKVIELDGPTEDIDGVILKLSKLRSYAGVCLEGAIIVLACIIFSVFAGTQPQIDPDAAAATMV